MTGCGGAGAVAVAVGGQPRDGAEKKGVLQNMLIAIIVMHAMQL